MTWRKPHLAAQSQFIFGLILAACFVAAAPPAALALPRCAQLQNPLCLLKLLLREESIDSIRIKRPPRDAGKYLSVFYARTSEARKSTGDTRIHVIEVKHVVPSILVGTDSIILPRINLSANPGEPNAYDQLLFVFHNEIQYFWSNADGSHPLDPRFAMGAVFQPARAARIWNFTRAALGQIPRRQSHAKELVLTF